MLVFKLFQGNMPLHQVYILHRDIQVRVQPFKFSLVSAFPYLIEN